MQEDLENRSVTLIVNSSKFTARTLHNALSKFLEYSKHKARDHKNIYSHGKQSVKRLIGLNEGVSTVDLGKNASFGLFDKIARKYNVDYAVKKVEKDGETRHLIFFKGKDRDAVETAMAEYLQKSVPREKTKDRVSIRQQLRRTPVQPERNRPRAVNREISR